jgi:hypothetical protein
LNDLFLPVSREDMLQRGMYYYDFLLITGDAYVDHPSFGTPVIGRVLEAEGYRVAILPQPDWKSAEAFAAMGRPRYAAMISAGNLDSMVAPIRGETPQERGLLQPRKKADCVGRVQLYTPTNKRGFSGPSGYYRGVGGLIAAFRPL